MAKKKTTKKKTTRRKSTALATQQEQAPKRRRGPSPKLKKTEAALEKTKKALTKARKKAKELKDSRGNVIGNAAATAGGVVTGTAVGATVRKIGEKIWLDSVEANPTEPSKVGEVLANPVVSNVVPAVLGAAVAAFSGKSAAAANIGIGMAQPLLVHGVDAVAEKIKERPALLKKSKKKAPTSEGSKPNKELGGPTPSPNRQSRAHYRNLGAPPPRRGRAQPSPRGRLEAGHYAREQDFVPQGM